MVILVVFNSFNVVKNLKKPDLVARQKPPFYTTTTGTYNFVSVILNGASVVLLISATAGLFPCAVTASLFAWLVNTHFLYHVKVKDTSKLSNGMSNVLQKLLTFFNGTTISTFCSVLSPNFPLMPVL